MADQTVDSATPIDPTRPCLFDTLPFLDPAVMKLNVREKADYRHVHNLSSNESDLPETRALFRRYLEQATETNVTRYPNWPGLIRTTARFYDVPHTSLVMDAGSDSAIRMVLGLLGRSIGRLILQTPNYSNYNHYAALAGVAVTPLNHPTDLWGESIVDLAREPLTTSPPALVVVTNPNGITGTRIPLAEMQRLCDLCAQGNHLLLIDEAYAPFASVPHLPLLHRYSGVVILRSFSKNCGMAGLRLGLVITSAALAAYLHRWYGVHTVNAMAAGYLAFCFDNASDVANFHHRIEATRKVVARRVSHLFPSWRIPPSETNFLLMDTGQSGTASLLADHLRTRKIQVKRFEDGPHGLRSCLRMTIGDPTLMTTVLSEMESFSSQEGDGS
ncbi:MAG: histidinol-phosphate aminotransferase family protein [Magnetococcales bacterium]|nr:histidinol-phosphate aminotransferase family protein [Magnetococcales bacterium]